MLDRTKVFVLVTTCLILILIRTLTGSRCLRLCQPWFDLALDIERRQDQTLCVIVILYLDVVRWQDCVKSAKALLK